MNELFVEFVSYALLILFILGAPTVYVIVRQYLKAKRKENGEP